MHEKEAKLLEVWHEKMEAHMMWGKSPKAAWLAQAISKLTALEGDNITLRNLLQKELDELMFGPSVWVEDTTRSVIIEAKNG